MQQINDFVSYPSDSNKKELIEIVCNIMKIEYLKETKNLKQNIMKKLPENELLFNFSDILLWLHKINATETSQEMKNVWDTNNNEVINKIDEFFRKFAEKIIDRHIKYSVMIRKNQKIQKLIKRTSKFSEGLDNIFRELSFLKFEDEISQTNFSNQKFSFIICIDSLENFDMINVFKDKDYLGHHLELGYGERVIFTPTETTNGRVVDYRKIQLTLPLDYRNGNIFINLYEDFLREVKIDKSLVAKRNLDLFSELSKNSIAKLIASECKDEKFMHRFANILNGLYDEDELDQDDTNQMFRMGNSSEENKTGMKLLQNNQKNLYDINDDNINKENGDSSFKFERFSLFKINNASTKSLIIDSKTLYVSLKMHICCENLKNLHDLHYYSKMIKSRKNFLKQKFAKNLHEIVLFKKILQSMIIPFKALSFDENHIKIQSRFLSIKEEIKRKSCIIF